MELTKHGHSCVSLVKDGQTLVIDPGNLSDPVPVLAGANGVLITHEHADHVDYDIVRAEARLHTDLHIWAPSSVTSQLDDLGRRVSTIEPDSHFEAVGFSVRTFGGQHALIHPSIRTVDNVAYLIDDTVYHPGDSFTVPTAPVGTLLVPIHAPWSKVGEVIDFVVSVRAPYAFPIHDGLLNAAGLGVVEGHVERIGAMYGSVYRHLAPGETTDIEPPRSRA